MLQRAIDIFYQQKTGIGSASKQLGVGLNRSKGNTNAFYSIEHASASFFRQICFYFIPEPSSYQHGWLIRVVKDFRKSMFEKCAKIETPAAELEKARG